MAAPSVAILLSECHISVSQEEVLSNLSGGWERSGHYSLDETPSQNLLNLNAEPPMSPEGDCGSESSESVDAEGDMGYSQDPVEWISPSSSPQAAVGVERNDPVAKEDSYVAAFESDRSQSPGQDWHGQTEPPVLQVQTPNFGMSAEFFTQPVSGVMNLQFASYEDRKDQIVKLETIPESEFLVLTGSSLVLPPIPENGVSVIEAPAVVMQSIMQPFTQPAFETQPLESLNLIQEYASQIESAGGRNDIVHDTTVIIKERADAEEPELAQEGSGRDVFVNDAPALDSDNGHIGSAETMPQVMGGGKLARHSLLPVNDRTDLRSTERKQQEDRSHDISNDMPLVVVQRGDSGFSDKAQQFPPSSKVSEFDTGWSPSDSAAREQNQRGNGDMKSFPRALKRENCAEEFHGRQKLQRVEASPVRARSFPKTVMDVVRSRSRSFLHRRTAKVLVVRCTTLIFNLAS